SDLRASQTMLATAEHIARVGSWNWNIVTNELIWSDEMCRMFGYTPGTFTDVYQGWMVCVHPDDQKRVQEAIDAAVAGLKPYDIEYPIVGRDGAQRIIHAKGVIFCDESGKPVRMVGTCHDTTERKTAEDQIRQLQKMEAVGKLTGGVAHDFNNLLAIMGGNLELLEERLVDSPALHDLAENARRAVDRGATLTRSLLAFSRQQPLSPRVIDLKKLVQEMANLIRGTVPETIDIEVVTGTGLWRCEADPGQLQNALLNLVANARDAMPEGGKLTIETANARLDDDYAAAQADVAPGQYVMLAVSDTGQGMPPEVVARAFEPFFTTKGPGKGVGLGLSMVYGFAKQSNGYAKIYSEVGHGSTVRIYLPRSTAAVEELALTMPASDLSSKGETILVVEDDADVRSLACSLLRSFGYEVFEAGDPQGALQAVRHTPRVALLLTDVVLPGGMNGPKLAEEILRLQPQIKVLYMSGYTENAILHHGRLDPAVHLLQKPFTKRELASKIRLLLKGKNS
ncbi:MAG: PAS domain-containing protein, partial [Alphaproteobacteria bacterium]